MKTNNDLITRFACCLNASNNSNNFAIDGNITNLPNSLNTGNFDALKDDDSANLTGGFYPSDIDNLIPGNNCRKGIRCKWSKAKHLFIEINISTLFR